MKKYLTRLNAARASLVTSILIGEGSLMSTFYHIGDDRFLLAGFTSAGDGLPNTHGWYHFLREGVAGVVTLALLCLFLFGPNRFRSPETWVIGLALCFGYYAPFWIGMPFNSALSAPNLGAELTHIGMAVFALAALFIAKREFDSQPLANQVA